MIYLKNVTGETQEVWFPKMEEVLEIAENDADVEETTTDVP